MTDHLPECMATEFFCLCDALRACEQRIAGELLLSKTHPITDEEWFKIQYWGGFSDALDAAEAAVTEVAPFDIPALLLKREEVIAAIRALKES